MPDFDESEGRWVTINGTHIFITKGDTVGSSINKMKLGSKTSGRHPTFVKVAPKGAAPMTQVHKDVVGVFNKYKDKYDTGHKELKELHKKQMDFEGKRDAAWKAHQAATDPKEKDKLLKEYRELTERVTEARWECVQKTKEIGAITTNIREDARKVLFPTTSTPTGNLKYTAQDADLPQGTRIVCDIAQANLNSFFVSNNLPDVPVWRYRDADQRSCGGSVGIWLADIATTEVAMHEMAHCIEGRDKGLFARIIKFYNDRTSGDKIEWLAQKYPNSGYRPDERVKADKWPDEYCGKYYDDQSTEILAMGFTMLWRSPVKFAMKDPEYFNFMVDICKTPVKKMRSPRTRKPKAPKPSTPRRRKK